MNFKLFNNVFVLFVVLILLSNGALAQIQWYDSIDGTDNLIWANGAKEITLILGESSTFSTGYFDSSYSNTVHLIASLNNKNTGETVQVLMDKDVDVSSYLGYEEIAVTPNDYETVGEYVVVISLSDGQQTKTNLNLLLTVVEDNNVSGCTDENAINYNPEATIDDGSCEYVENYDPSFRLTPKAEDTLLIFFPYYHYELGESVTIEVIGTDTDGTLDAEGNLVYEDDATVQISMSAGHLPPGLTFIQDESKTFGTIQGTPTETGNFYAITLTAIDQQGAEFSYPIIFDINEKDDTNPLGNFIFGCTDENAVNYNPEATTDDGSCAYDISNEVLGCTHSNAINYNPAATIDDGSCAYALIYGCTDQVATNYDSDATIDDGSCVYGFNFIFGCTDENAVNYNPEATTDDGSCAYDISNEVLGCTHSNAINYNPAATIDDGSCAYALIYGCTDSEASNYNAQATIDDGSCEYACVDTDGDGICDEDEVPGCMDESALNYNPAATDDDGSCEYACVDTDGDGICDVDDNCPLDPEDFDGVEDEDGCPESYAPLAYDMIVTTEEDSAVTFTLGAEDTDGQVVAYKILTFPTDGILSGTAPVLTYIPTENFNGEDMFTFQVFDDDGLESNVATVMITVGNVNDAPQIISSPNTIAKQDELYNYQVIAVDADNDPLTYSLSVAPEGMVIDENGLISWTPENNQREKVTVCVSDYQYTTCQGYEINTQKAYQNLQISSVRLSSEEAMAGEYLVLKIDTVNNGDLDFRGLKADVLIYDMAIKRSTGKFNLDAGDQETKTVGLQIPYDITPGEYLIKVNVGNDYYHETTYRLITIY